MTARQINKQIANDIMSNLPESKKATLSKALDRNFILTSTAVLSGCEMRIYKQGWQLNFTGTRCCFSVYANDNDGDFEITRKPSENSLNLLYTCDLTNSFNESDFESWIR